MEIRKIIESKISKEGYICLDDFMRIAMSEHPGSYYRNVSPIGEAQDFITAPEVSQMFGEMICLWAIDAWEKLGRPKKCNIIEFGSGTGKLLRDFLRIASMEKDFYAGIKAWIIDINANLISAQKEILKDHTKVQWVKSLEEVPDAPSIVIANEFFDALPIKQYQKSKDTWLEKVITLDAKNNFEFLLKDIDEEIQQKISEATPGSSNNSVFEVSVPSQNMMKQIAKYIKVNKGYVLAIDYGYDIKSDERKKEQYTSTLQALKQHKYISFFKEVGGADLTSHVDFSALKKVAKSYNLKCFGAINQGDFLRSCGIELRLNLLQKANPDLAKTLHKQYDRLTSKDQMGELFKVVSISSEIIAPIGFE